MLNYYQILGLSTAATPDELRRAYRILARRYHPDVNPGKASEEKFKRIAEAYAILQDPAKRKSFDQELEKAYADSFTSSFDKAHEAYRRQQGFERAHDRGRTGHRASTRQETVEGEEPTTPRSSNRSKQRRSTPVNDPLAKGPGGAFSESVFKFASKSQEVFGLLKERIPTLKRKRKVTTEPDRSGTQVSQVSIIEISVHILDAIRGQKKTVELNDGTSIKKISVTIPPGVRTGSVIRFRRRERNSEEIVLIVRVAAHPILAIAAKGLVMEVPITVKEAILGARIKIPTLEEQTTVFVEPGTQSGAEVRLRGQGIPYRDGTKGDLFVRFLIRMPESLGAVGLTEAVENFEKYYERPLRHSFPSNILDM